MRDMFKMVDAVLRTHSEVGEYNKRSNFSLVLVDETSIEKHGLQLRHGGTPSPHRGEGGGEGVLTSR
jgi:hypothetical protein